MDQINFKRKTYDVIEKLGDITYKVSLKGKIFVIKQFHQGSEEFDYFISHLKTLKISGVSIPKVIKIDKKAEMVLMEFVDGLNVFDVLKTKDLNEDFYKPIFEQAWLAKNERITLDYHPDFWILTPNKKLVYTKFDYQDGYDDAINFETTQIKLWFFTKEFYNYAKTKGFELDKSRLQDEYKINKEIVLNVVKYHV